MLLRIEQKDIDYFRKKILKWGKNNYDSFPWRETENKWHALVAEIMLQRTRAEQVLPVYSNFTEKYMTPGDFLQSSNVNIFNKLGLLWRFEKIKLLAEILCDKTIPSEKRELLKLPGIGDYIASAYRSLHLCTRELIIDSNVVRIYGRFFGFPTTPETRRNKFIKDLADKVTPLSNFKDFNYALIDYTRKICKLIPGCRMCVIKKRCKSFEILKYKRKRQTCLK